MGACMHAVIGFGSTVSGRVLFRDLGVRMQEEERRGKKRKERVAKWGVSSMGQT